MTKPKKPKAASLREIYSVRFELGGGHWTDSCGRFATKGSATKWAGELSHTVVLELLEPGEQTRYTSKKGLDRLMDNVKAGLL